MDKGELTRICDLVADEILDRNIETKKDYNKQSDDIIKKVIKVLLNP